MSFTSYFVIFYINISKIIDCGLERIGDLPNEFVFGACGTFEFPTGEERVMLCFSGVDKHNCVRWVLSGNVYCYLYSSNEIFLSYNGRTYSDHPNSDNSHYYTSLGNLDNKVFASGGGNTFSTGNNKVEIFDINANTWATKVSFPYCSMYVKLLQIHFFYYLASMITDWWAKRRQFWCLVAIVIILLFPL